MFLAPNRWAAEEVFTLAAADVDTTYNPVVSSSSPNGQFKHPARQIMFVNATDQIVVFSLDGVTDNWIMLAGTSFIDDIASNQINLSPLQAPINQIIYVRYLSDQPTTNGIYVTAFYAAGGN